MIGVLVFNDAALPKIFAYATSKPIPISKDDSLNKTTQPKINTHLRL